MEMETIQRIDDSLAFVMVSQGNTAEIYLYDANKILKLFRKGIPFELISAEYKAAGTVRSELENVPDVYAVVLYREQYGIIYERIDGSDMIKVMLKNISQFKSYSKSLAQLHSEIHKITVNMHCSVKQKLCSDIDAATILSPLEKNQIKSYIDTLPDGESLCHFDFHPGNVMIQEHSPFIIDWMTACTGDPGADAARTVILMQYGELTHANLLIKMVASIFEKRIGAIYYNEYRKITGLSEYAIEQWILPVASARLVEWISEGEKAKLLKLVKEKLSLLKEPDVQTQDR